MKQTKPNKDPHNGIHIYQHKDTPTCGHPNKNGTGLEDGHGQEHGHGHGQGCDCGAGHGHRHADGHMQEHGCSCGTELGHGQENGHMQEHRCSCGEGHEHRHADGHMQEHGCSCAAEHGHRHTDGLTQEQGCSCGAEHGHRHADGHMQEHGCSCGTELGHGQENGHMHGQSCGCGTGHGHKHAEPGGHHPDISAADGVKLAYLVENLGCANCAAKMERRIHELPEVNAATLTFATKQLRVAVTAVAADDADKLLAKFQDICSSIEPEVIVSRQAVSQKGKKALQPTASKEAAQKSRKQKIGLISILTGAVLFILGEVLEQAGIGASFLPPLIFVLAYLILGSEILAAAGKNIVRGQVFDENFLMGIATLGAFAIGNFPEAVGVMLFYRIGEYFEEAAVSRSRSQIMDAVDLRPEVVNLVVGDGTKAIPAEEAQPGDLLFIRPGDRIPLDGVITEGESRLDTSPITGEPVPIRASAGDPVTSGCINLSGALSIRVEKNLEHSMVTRILDSVENAAASKPKIDRFITRFSRIYTPFVVAAAFATAILPSLVTGDWRHWIYTALTFLVISCPCALVLSVPLAFFSGIGSGSKRGILFKGGVSIEALGRISTVIMDKTGTVTKGDFALQKVTPFHGYEEEEILTLCASCEQQSTHPIGVSITAAAREKGLALEQTASLEEIAGQGICATLSAGKVLAGNRKLMERFQIDTSGCSQSSFGTEVLLAVDGKLAGCLAVSDTIKPEAQTAIQALKKLNIRTAMLTGDASESAQAVAEATGIDEVHAKLLPEGKLSKLQEIRKEHGAAMFVGDGINDAPVLAGADVGAAMGSGADAAIEAADVVFMTSNMEAVPDSITIAKATTRIAWQNVVFALGIKAVVMALGLTGYASMWMAVFADSGVAMLCVLNSIRLLYKK